MERERERREKKQKNHRGKSNRKEKEDMGLQRKFVLPLLNQENNLRASLHVQLLGVKGIVQHFWEISLFALFPKNVIDRRLISLSCDL